MASRERTALRIRSIVVTSAVLAGCCLLAAPKIVAEDKSLIDQVREEDEQRETRWTGFSRIRAGYPQGVSAGLGVIRARLPESWGCATACPFRGLTVQLEPGIRGVQLSAGFATLVAEKRHRKYFLADVHLAFGVKGVLLQRWDEARLAAAERTFAGIEFSFTVTRINFSIGTLRRVDRIAGDDWIVSAGMGWGF
jgi:hypothetical protein